MPCMPFLPVTMTPKTASRPFDLDRDGFVLGEGAASLIFEEMEHAMARGARIYCEVAGGGLSADAYHMTAPHPEGLGARNAMKYALQDAGMELSDIQHINTHALEDDARAMGGLPVTRRHWQRRAGAGE